MRNDDEREHGDGSTREERLTAGSRSLPPDRGGDGAERSGVEPGRRPDPGEEGEKFTVTPEIDVRDRDEGYHRIPSSDERAMGGVGKRHPEVDEADAASADAGGEEGAQEDGAEQEGRGP